MTSRLRLPAALLALLLLAAAPAAHAADGDLDGSLDGEGIRTVNCAGDDDARDVLVQPDGKIVMVGRSSGAANPDFCIVRLNADGSPDTTFGAAGFLGQTFDGDGVTQLTFGQAEGAEAVTRQADGKLVIVGSTNETGTGADTGDVAIARLNADGTRDASFSGDGRFQFEFVPASPDTDDAGTDVAVQPGTGQLLVGGSTLDGNEDFGVARIDAATGTIDNGYGGGDGRVTRTFGGIEVGHALVTEPDGKAVLAGSTLSAGTVDFGAARFTANGEPDQTWGDTGERVVNFGGGDAAFDIVPYQGGYVLAGFANGEDVALVRLDGGGDVDTGFDGDGKVTTNLGTIDIGRAITTSVDGKLLVAGNTDNGASPTNFFLAKYTPTGALDPSFAGIGVQVTDLGGTDEVPLAVTRDANGHALVAGHTNSGANPKNMGLVRYSDSLPTVSVGNAQTTEGLSTGVPVTLNKTSGVPVTANFATADGTATAGADYDAASGGVTINPGETSASIPVFARADDLLEPFEKFGVSIVPTAGAALGSGQAETTILNVPIETGKCKNVLRGGAAADTLTGSPFGDLIEGLAANDKLTGAAGDDCLRGGAGNDRANGGDGNDTLTGDSGNDNLNGAAGRDKVSGGSGKNKLTGAAGNDTLTGGSGADSASGGDGNDKIATGSGNDKISTGAGTNTVSAGAGNDVVGARNGKVDTINCGKGRGDRATVDRGDKTSSCETVNRARK